MDEGTTRGGTGNPVHRPENPAGSTYDPGIKPGSPTLQADALTSEPPGKPKALFSSVQLLSHVRLFATP